MFKGSKSLMDTKPKNLPKKDALMKKPDKKVLKMYGDCLDKKHPFRKKRLSKEKKGEEIFDKSSSKKKPVKVKKKKIKNKNLK